MAAKSFIASFCDSASRMAPASNSVRLTVPLPSMSILANLSRSIEYLRPWLPSRRLSKSQKVSKSISSLSSNASAAWPATPRVRSTLNMVFDRPRDAGVVFAVRPLAMDALLGIMLRARGPCCRAPPPELRARGLYCRAPPPELRVRGCSRNRLSHAAPSFVGNSVTFRILQAIQ